jgi:hypothetical protein
MKYLALIPLMFIVSCASRPKPQVVLRSASPPAIDRVEEVRYSEIVRGYHVGRYVDPNHPETLHEQHPVYRIETSGRWNLHPGVQTSVTLLNLPRDAAFAPPPTNDVVLAEINRQREATERVMSQAVRLARSYDELQKVVGEMKTVARNNATMNARVAESEQRLTELRQELQKLTAQSATNAPPTATPIDFQKP